MVPAQPDDTERHPPERLGGIARGALVLLAGGLVAVFAIALWLDPYQSDGSARTMETHRQLGLPPCAYYRWTGSPCPSCGMTTAFALLVRGDVAGSLRANCAGTLVALTWLGLIPWAISSAVRARWTGTRSPEPWALGVVGGLLFVTLVRWGLVLAWARWGS